MPGNRPAGLRELLRTSGLGKQEALQRVEPQLARRKKIGPGFDTLPDGSRSVVIGEIEDLTTHRLFHNIAGAAFYETLIYFDLDKWKVSDAGKRCPFRSDVVQRKGNFAGTKRICDVYCQRQIADNVGAIDFYDQTFEGYVVWQTLTEKIDRL
jgi:hypothetical protein